MTRDTNANLVWVCHAAGSCQLTSLCHDCVTHFICTPNYFLFFFNIFSSLKNQISDSTWICFYELYGFSESNISDSSGTKKQVGWTTSKKPAGGVTTKQEYANPVRLDLRLDLSAFLWHIMLWSAFVVNICFNPKKMLFLYVLTVSGYGHQRV